MLIHLAEGLRERGYRVIPMGPKDGSGWLSASLRDRGFPHETFSIRRSIDPGAVRTLAESFREHQVNLVHSHEFQLAIYGSAAARMAGIPHIATLHGSRYYSERRHRRFALRWSALRSRALVAVSEAYAEALRRDLRLSADQVPVIPNGVPIPEGDEAPIRQELKLTEGEPLILAVGNLYPVKGHAVLLRALGHLQRARSDLTWRAAIAGRGQEESSLRRLADELGIGHRVHFLGLRDDVPDLLSAARLWVMPSLSEGLPLSLLEAMLAGVPIVASRVGGIPEAVGHDRSALLVPPDEPEALATALERMLRNPALRIRLASAARREALERFTVDAMIESYEQLYDLRSPRRTPHPQGRQVGSGREKRLRRRERKPGSPKRRSSLPEPRNPRSSS